MGLLSNISQCIKDSNKEWDEIAGHIGLSQNDIELIAKNRKPTKEFVQAVTRTIWCKLLEKVDVKYQSYQDISKLTNIAPVGECLANHSKNAQGTSDEQVVECSTNNSLNAQGTSGEQEKDVPSEKSEVVGPSSSENDKKQEKDIPSDHAEIVGPSSSWYDTNQDNVDNGLDVNKNSLKTEHTEQQEIGAYAGVVDDLEELYQRLDKIIQRGDNDELVRFFLLNKSDMKTNIQIIRASEKGYINIVQFLAKNGADVNVKANNGETPLHKASYNGHVSATPLHTASYNGHVNTVEFLTNNGADVNVKDKNGVTPLHTASYNGHVNTVEFLTNNGADVNVKTKNGETPLHGASYNGHVNTVEFLTNNGADVNVKNNNGETPLYLAKFSKHISIITLLECKKK